jgi:hypothetical protein
MVLLGLRLHAALCESKVEAALRHSFADISGYSLSSAPNRSPPRSANCRRSRTVEFRICGRASCEPFS